MAAARRRKRRAWRGLAYSCLSLATAVTLDAAVVVAFCLSVGLLFVYVGFPLLARTFELAASVARVERQQVERLFGVRIPDPRHGDSFRRAGRWWADSVAWRETAHAFAALVVAPFAFGMLLVVGAAGLGAVIWSAIAWAAVGNADGWGLSDHVPWPVALGAALIGTAVLVVVLPRLIAGVTGVQRRLAVRLLGPSRTRTLEHRVEQLTDSRNRSVDAAVAERRRIERDLHDGAQQRLVALAMDLGVAKEKFDADPEAARALLEAAHADAKHAIVELRDLARGIHPAVLSEAGLDGALSGLAARSNIPVAIDVDVASRPPERVEAVAYFVVAEALVNVTRHAQATRVEVRVVRRGDQLSIAIYDDGVGGADFDKGSGLAGLAARVASIDGAFRVDSPPGGPTMVIAELPCGS